jgi:hypothetical protein
MLAGVLLFGAVVTPVKAVTRSLTLIRRSFWASTGEPRPSGAIGQAALVTFGVLDLLDLVLRPAGMDLVDGRWTSPPALVAAIVMGAGVISLGLALIPQFTTSVIGIGVAIGHLILLAGADPCRDVTSIIVVGATFYGVSLLAQRFS